MGYRNRSKCASKARIVLFHLILRNEQDGKPVSRIHRKTDQHAPNIMSMNARPEGPKTRVAGVTLSPNARNAAGPELKQRRLRIRDENKEGQNREISALLKGYSALHSNLYSTKQIQCTAQNLYSTKHIQ